MAITINSVPALMASIHDDAWFVVSSNNKLSPNFKYVFDTYVSGAIISRVKIQPTPTGSNSYGVFNSAPIVRNYMGNYFKPVEGSPLQHTSNEIKVNYQVRFGEEVSGTITTNLASGNYAGYNYYSPLFFDGILLLGGGQGDLLLSEQNENLLISNYSDDWITERDISNVVMEFGKRVFVSFLRNEITTANIKVQKIDGSGAVLATASGALVSMTGEFNLFEFGENSINTYLGSAFIDEDTHGYKVTLISGLIETNPIIIYLKCYERTNPVNVHFLNRLGGWDTFSFNLVNKRATSFERRSYRKSIYQLDGSQMKNNDSYNRFNESTINFSIEHKDTFKLISDYINEEDNNWLAQLVASPNVYMEVRGAYFPITITDTNYQYKTESADQLFNLEMNIEVSKYLNSQYR